MLYFISDGTNTKIGITKNPLKRIKGLQTSNPNKLYFEYIFFIKDKYEKIIHNLLKDYKTSSDNEWFNLKEVDTFKILKQLSLPELKDLKLAEHKALNFNNLLNGMIKAKQQYKEKPINKEENKSKIKQLLDDVKNHLETKKNIRISYNIYIDKYGFTKDEISYYIKSAKLSKLIFIHNNSI